MCIRDRSRSAQKISLALTKFSLMDGMKVAGQKMSLRNVLMQLASGGEGSDKHHMGVYVVCSSTIYFLSYIFTRLSQSYHFYHLYHSFRSEENHSNTQRGVRVRFTFSHIFLPDCHNRTTSIICITHLDQKKITRTRNAQMHTQMLRKT